MCLCLWINFICAEHTVKYEDVNSIINSMTKYKYKKENNTCGWVLSLATQFNINSLKVKPKRTRITFVLLDESHIESFFKKKFQ